MMAFCHGEKIIISINFIHPVHSNSNFVQTLAAFKKPLVVYVKGIVNGLGVRILPLFDVVWSDVGASFTTTNQFDGEIIEGTALLSATDKIDYNAVSIVQCLWGQCSLCSLKFIVRSMESNRNRILIDCIVMLLFFFQTESQIAVHGRSAERSRGQRLQYCDAGT